MRLWLRRIQTDGDSRSHDATAQEVVGVKPVLGGLCSRSGCVVWNATGDIEDIRMLRGIGSEGSRVNCCFGSRVWVCRAKVCPGKFAGGIACKVCGAGISVQVIFDGNLTALLHIAIVADKAITRLVMLLQPKYSGIPIFDLSASIVGRNIV